MAKQHPVTKKSKKNLEKGRWQPGQSGNPKGRLPGQRPFISVYREAIAELAKQKKTTPEKLENMILQVGFARAMAGDYRFWQDIQDRLNGKPVQKNELTGADGKDLIPNANAVDETNTVIDRFLNDSKRNSK